MWLALEHGASSSGTTPFVQVIILVVAALAVSLIGYVFKKNRGMYTDLHDIKDVLITPKPSGLVPHPEPGLVEIVAGHTKTLNTLLKGTEALIVDKGTNDGSTSRDALNRIEEEQARVAERLEEKENK
jgi:hypothetical protein